MVVDGNSGELLQVLDTVSTADARGGGAGTRRHSRPARPTGAAEPGDYLTGLAARDAGGGGEGRADAPGDGRAAAGRLDPAGVAELAEAPERREGLSGGGAEVHGAGHAVIGARTCCSRLRAVRAAAGRIGASARPRPPAGIVSTDSWPPGRREARVRVVDIRTDVFTYLRGHLPGAVVPQHRDAARQPGRYPDPAAGRRRPTPRCSPGWASRSIGRW